MGINKAEAEAVPASSPGAADEAPTSVPAPEQLHEDLLHPKRAEELNKLTADSVSLVNCFTYLTPLS